jgi:16S rRNA processing protein RimM
MSDHDSGSAKGARGRTPFGVFVRKPVERASEVGVADGKQASVETAQAWPEDAVEVGAVVDAYGLKGWVKILAHAGAGRGGDALLKARHWWLEQKGGARTSMRVSQAKTHSDAIVAHPVGLDDRDAALALRGARVFVRRDDFPALSADEFYWVDLIGLEVINEAGVPLGVVADMIDNSVHSIMRITYPSTGKDGRPLTGERLIPFVGVYVKTVDQAARRIVVDWEADY